MGPLGTQNPQRVPRRADAVRRSHRVWRISTRGLVPTKSTAGSSKGVMDEPQARMPMHWTHCALAQLTRFLWLIVAALTLIPLSTLRAEPRDDLTIRDVAVVSMARDGVD